MRVRFWGTRGSIATPGPETWRYGGNTSCVEVWTDSGTLLIFDCGTGARELGTLLAQAGPVRAHLFVGHTHMDHIQGLPFFVPAFVPGSHLTIYGPAGIDRSLPTAIGGQMEYAYFPVPMGELPAEIDFHELDETEFPIGDVRVRTRYLNHTVPTVGFRVEVGGATLVYSADHEPYANALWRPGRPEGSYDLGDMLHPSDAEHAQFLANADLVIHDAQYTEEEYPKKVGWGHSTVEYAIDMAIAARVKRLALYHHDPTRNDEAMDRLVALCQERAARVTTETEIAAAAELSEIAIPERVPAAPVAPPSLGTPRILIVDDDEVILATLERALRLDGYEVVRATNGREAVDLSQQQRFNLILLDVEMPEMSGLTAARILRSEQRLDIPIVMLTRRAEAEDFEAGFAQGVTDYMTKPFAIAQLRARVRSWLTRSARPTPNP